MPGSVMVLHGGTWWSSINRQVAGLLGVLGLSQIDGHIGVEGVDAKPDDADSVPRWRRTLFRLLTSIFFLVLFFLFLLIFLLLLLFGRCLILGLRSSSFLG